MNPNLPDSDRVRLDIWLWRARLFKTRSLAAKAISKNRIRLQRGGQIFRIKKVHSEVTPGDRLVFMKAAQLFEIEILDVGHRRGPAQEARRLYRDITVRDTLDEKPQI